MLHWLFEVAFSLGRLRPRDERKLCCMCHLNEHCSVGVDLRRKKNTLLKTVTKKAIWTPLDEGSDDWEVKWLLCLAN